MCLRALGRVASALKCGSRVFSTHPVYGTYRTYAREDIDSRTPRFAPDERPARPLPRSCLFLFPSIHLFILYIYIFFFIKSSLVILFIFHAPRRLVELFYFYLRSVSLSVPHKYQCIDAVFMCARVYIRLCVWKMHSRIRQFRSKEMQFSSLQFQPSRSLFARRREFENDISRWARRDVWSHIHRCI